MAACTIPLFPSLGADKIGGLVLSWKPPMYTACLDIGRVGIAEDSYLVIHHLTLPSRLHAVPGTFGGINMLWMRSFL